MRCNRRTKMKTSARVTKEKSTTLLQFSKEDCRKMFQDIKYEGPLW